MKTIEEMQQEFKLAQIQERHARLMDEQFRRNLEHMIHGMLNRYFEERMPGQLLETLERIEEKLDELRDN